MRFFWIDDDNIRQDAANNMARELDVEIKFISAKDRDIDVLLSDILKAQNEPDLVIMDHVLTNVISHTARRGSTAATRIKEKWPECPVVSVTAALDDTTPVDTRQRAAYENMFPADSISNYYDAIRSIAVGFENLKKNRPKEPDEVPKCLGCPEQEIERMIKILPDEIKIEENFNDASLLIELYRWCNTVLLKRPGFLYDELWTATYLGLTIEGFKTVSEQFESAKYNGVFQDASQPRWWKSLLIEILSEKIDKVGMPWLIGRSLVEEEKYYSKDYAKGEDFPETVAAVDQTIPADWRPMKLKYSESHPSFENLLFFEELRIMKAAE